MSIASRKQRRGISPAIGMLLMVSVTVILFVGVANILFGATSDVVQEKAKAGVEVSKGDGKLGVRLTNNKNAEEVFVRPPDGSGKADKSLSKVGDASVLKAGGGTYQVVAVVDGSEQVLRSIEVEGATKSPVKILSGPTKAGSRGFNTTISYSGTGTFDTVRINDNRGKANTISELDIQDKPKAAPGKSPNEIELQALKNGQDGELATSAGKGGKNSYVPTGKDVKFSNYPGGSNPPKATSGTTKFKISILGSEDKIKSVGKGTKGSAEFELVFKDTSKGTKITVPISIDNK